MSRDELIMELEKKGMEEVVELIEDADSGDLTELELVPSLGLLRDEELNSSVLNYLKSQGVSIIYAKED